MADDQTALADDSGSSDNGVMLNSDQIMQIINQAHASTPPQSPYQQMRPQQPMMQPPPRPAPAVQPPPQPQMQQQQPAAGSPWTQQQNQPQTEKVTRETKQDDSELNIWQKIYKAMQDENPGAKPNQLVASMKAFKDAGAFEMYAKHLGKTTETTTTTKSGGTQGVGKTVEEQVYASLIKQGMNPQQAASVVQNMRGISPEMKGQGAGAVETAKKEADIQVNKPKAEEKLDDINNGMDNTIKFINMARKQVSGFTTGAGSLLSEIPGTPAKDLAATVSTIKANIGFDKLQTMKDESPNGSALGRVTNMEIQLLQNVVANLDTSQSAEQFNLHLDIAQEEVEKAKKRIADAYDLTYGSGGAAAAEKAVGGATGSSGAAPAQSKTVNWNDLQ